MIEYEVLYKGLNSTGAINQEFEDSQLLCPNHNITGYQRALIVIKNQDNLKIKRAYSVAGYFIDRDGEPSGIIFDKESTSWSDKQVEGRLMTGKVLDTIVELNEEDVIGKKENELNYPLRTADGKVLEKYLMNEKGAFRRLDSEHWSAIQNLLTSKGIFK